MAYEMLAPNADPAYIVVHGERLINLRFFDKAGDGAVRECSMLHTSLPPSTTLGMCL